MSIRPLDLQVNINSTVELSKTEGAKLARVESDQRFLDDKLNKIYESADKRITEMSNSEPTSKTDNEKVNEHLDSSYKKKKKKEKHQMYKKSNKHKDQFQLNSIDSEESLDSKRIDFLV